jgi:hypothetical protein
MVVRGTVLNATGCMLGSESFCLKNQRQQMVRPSDMCTWLAVVSAINDSLVVYSRVQFV